MKKNRNDMHAAKSLIRGAEGIAEILLLTILYYTIWRNGYDPEYFPSYFGYGKYVLSGVYALIVCVLFFTFDGFKFGYLRLTDVLISQWIALFITNFITYWQLCLIANVTITPVPMLVLMVVDAIVSLVCALCYTRVYHHMYVPKKMLMVFGRDDAITLKFKMDMRSDKYHIEKLVHESAGAESICKIIEEYDAVILSDVTAEVRNDILKYCYQNEIRTYIAPKISDIVIRGGESISLFDTPLLLVKGKGLSPVQKFFKRMMDIVICLVALVVALPIMLVVAAAIKLEDGGPVFFTQKRATLGGREFDILKFRSMIVDAEKEGKSIPATGHDPRITKVGRVIRATRIDELPQILNILKGDMSVVGPRPERLEHVQKYSEDLPEFAYRLKVKGGLTGYAQIYGKYNTSAYDKLRLDLMYIANYSLLLDIKLILLTIRVMLQKESTEGFEKLEEFEKMKQEALRQVSENKNSEEDLHV